MNFSVHSVGAQAFDMKDNIYFNLAEYAYVTLDLKTSKERIKLFKNRKFISEEEFELKKDALLCLDIIFYSEYKKFIQNVSYIPSEKLSKNLNQREKELEEEFEEKEPNCDSKETEKYFGDIWKMLELRVAEEPE